MSVAHFNLAEYQTVQERIDLFRELHSDGRIENEIVYVDEKSIIVKASIYLNATDEHPTCSDLAHEVKDASPVNKTSWVENAATSATGRAISLLGGKFSPKGKRPSREEMAKVSRGNAAAPVKHREIDPKTAKTIDDLNNLWAMALEDGRTEELQPAFTSRKLELS